MTNNFFIISSNESQDLDLIKYNFISNLNFQTPWLNLAKSLGFFVDFSSSNNISISDSEYIIQKGKTLSEGDFQMIVSDLNFEFLPNTISIQNQIIENLVPETLTTATIKNSSNSYVKTTKTLAVTTQKKTSVSSSHKISNSLSVKQTYTASIFALTASLSIDYKFSHKFTLGNQQVKIKSTQITETVNASVPPKSSIPINILSYKTNTKTPFTALVKINYKITFKGLYNTINTPNKEISRTLVSDAGVAVSYIPFSFTFGTDQLSANEDLQKQYSQDKIPGVSKWNWTLFNNITSTTNILTFFPFLFKGFALQLNGKFEQDDSSFISIEAGTPIPL